eukprot:1160002-Pelagomonas_calceolata.AAC.14
MRREELVEGSLWSGPSKKCEERSWLLHISLINAGNRGTKVAFSAAGQQGQAAGGSLKHACAIAGQDALSAAGQQGQAAGGAGGGLEWQASAWESGQAVPQQEGCGRPALGALRLHPRTSTTCHAVAQLANKMRSIAGSLRQLMGEEL